MSDLTHGLKDYVRIHPGDVLVAIDRIADPDLDGKDERIREALLAAAGVSKDFAGEVEALAYMEGDRLVVRVRAELGGQAYGFESAGAGSHRAGLDQALFKVFQGMAAEGVAP